MKVVKSSVLPAVFCLALVLAGCDSVLRERGTTWADLGLIPNVEAVAGVAVTGGDVVVATSDGVWRRPLNRASGWTRSGLDGLQVRALRAIPDKPGTVVAGVDPMGAEEVVSFYRSTDGGKTWTESGEGLFMDMYNAYAPVEEVVVRPGTEGEELFANLQGSSIVHSADGGASWQLVQGALDGFGYPCLLHIPQSDPNALYQGCEAPLDDAWIRRYDLSDPNRTELGEGELLVGLEQISNRRINAFTSLPSQPGVVYAGIEGGLIALEDDDWRWIWRHEGNEDTTGVNYTYVKFIWVDPTDPDHIVFGGGDGPAEDDTRAGLFETFDGGETVIPITTGPGGLRFDRGGVRAGAVVGGSRDVVLAALTPFGARVIVREHRP